MITICTHRIFKEGNPRTPLFTPLPLQQEIILTEHIIILTEYIQSTIINLTVSILLIIVNQYSANFDSITVSFQAHNITVSIVLENIVKLFWG